MNLTPKTHLKIASKKNPLGFSVDLKRQLKKNNLFFNEYISKQKLWVNSEDISQSSQMIEEENHIRKSIEKLKRIQCERGFIKCNDKIKKEIDTIPKKMCFLEAEGNNLRTKIEILQKENHELKSVYNKTLKLEYSARMRSNSAFIEKKQIEEGKRLTINDLTHAVLKYKMLGLEFSQGKKHGLKCSFKYINRHNPERAYSFVLFIKENIVYGVEDCDPKLEDDTLCNLLNGINTSGEFSVFILGMRNAFKKQFKSRKRKINNG